MAQNDWAIVIGINEYEHHPERNLSYAVSDAQLMQEFLCSYAGFPEDQVLLCRGEAQYQGQPTYPTFANLIRWLNREWHPEKIGEVNRFWFFFSGHGLSSEGNDYLITCDSLLEDTQFNIMLPVQQVIASLRRHRQADIVLILDNCREQVGAKNLTSRSLGEETLELARKNDIVTIRSCEYGQFSYELANCQQGAFTYALLEGLREHTLPTPLERYVQRRVAELNKHSRQTPKISLNSSGRGQFPLLPERCVTAEDLKTLERRAWKAQATASTSVEYKAAERLWWQIIRAAQNRQLLDEAQEAIQSLYRKSLENEVRQEVEQELNQLRQEAAEATRQLEALEQQQGNLGQLQREKAELERQLAELRLQQAAEREQWQAEAVKQVQRVQDSAQAKINQLNTTLETLQTQLEAKEKRKQQAITAQTEQAEQIKKLNQQIQAMQAKMKPESPTLQNISSTARIEQSNTTFDLPNNGGKLELITVPSGTLTMEGGRKIHLQPFLMGKYSVTQRQYQAVMGENPSRFQGDLDRPVEMVNWHEAIAFCEKLSEILKQDIDLPSETQWEWAARGATQSQRFEYAGSNNLDEVGWYHGNSGKQTHPVGQKKPNELGLYDMSGNVWEWCKDNWADNVEKLPADGSPLTKGGDSNYRVLRSGSWDSDPGFCRSAYRGSHSRVYRLDNIGFRVACPSPRTR